MTDEPTGGNHGEHHHGGVRQNMTNIGRSIYQRFGDFWQARGLGYLRKPTKEPEATRSLTGIGEMLTEEGVIAANIDKVDRLKQIEGYWSSIEKKRVSIEEIYTEISHYTNEEKIVDEIGILEYGTNVVPPNHTDRTTGYIAQAKTRGNPLKIRKADGSEEIIHSLTELIPLLRTEEGEDYFNQIQLQIKSWVNDNLNLPKLAEKIDDKNLERFLKTVVVEVPVYTKLEISPVSRLHFGGGLPIGPKKAEKPFSYGTRHWYELKKTIEFARSNKEEFTREFLQNEENKRILVDWVAKEINLRRLSKLISRVSTADEFLALFPEDAEKYKEPTYCEEVSFFGTYRMRDILPIVTNLKTKVQGQPWDRIEGVDTGKRDDFIKAIDAINSCFNVIASNENSFKEYIGDSDNGIIGKTKKVYNMWPSLFTKGLSPEDLLMKHTYEVCQRYRTTPEKNKIYKRTDTNESDTKITMTLTENQYNDLSEEERSQVEIQETKGDVKIEFFEEIHPDFKRPEEIEAGFDERGMPLEVYAHSDGNYYVLTDYWFYKMAQNKWQMQKILSKIGKDEFVKLFTGRANFSEYLVNPKGEVREKFTFNVGAEYNGGDGRKIEPGFHDRIDILEVVNYLNTNWDAYRDDFRDGRSHPHSKTFSDYVEAAHRFNVVKQKWKWPWSTTIPITQITKGMVGWNPDPWKRVPVHEDKDSYHKGRDHKLPKDERKVTREFEMEYYEDKGCTRVGKLRKRNEDGSLVTDKSKQKYIRRPTHMNPAYDRAALSVADVVHGHGGHTPEGPTVSTSSDSGGGFSRDGPPEGRDWVHWGRMYYYADSGEINKYAENPDPAIGTRGIGKYIMDRAIRQAWTFEEAVRTASLGNEYDLGVRGQTKPMLENPFGGQKGRDHYLKVKNATTQNN
jgi:hypothetical protein